VRAARPSSTTPRAGDRLVETFATELERYEGKVMRKRKQSHLFNVFTGNSLLPYQVRAHHRAQAMKKFFNETRSRNHGSDGGGCWIGYTIEIAT